MVLVVLLIAVLQLTVWAQKVYQQGTFISIPSGKHINHSYYGPWNVYFAAEDGVLIYDHHRDRWLDPITASDGLVQYPALLVWYDEATQYVWIVTPDYVFLYDRSNDRMSRQALPLEPEFSGRYSIGVTSGQVVVTSLRENDSLSYSAVYHKATGIIESWGIDSSLAVNWQELEKIESIQPDFRSFHENLAVQNIISGSFDAAGYLHLDGYPIQAQASVSAISGESESGELFLSTHGMGIFHRKLRGSDLTLLPFGLLSPDVMCMGRLSNELVIGGRAGLTLLKKDLQVRYEEAFKEPVFDFSFVSAIDHGGRELYIAGRGGVFSKDGKGSDWKRIVTKKDLGSDRIYSIAVGQDGNLMIATERNAYLYHRSGQFLETVFTADLYWPVFDITYSAGRYYLATNFGLYIYDEKNKGLTTRISSHAEIQSPLTSDAVDPIYEVIIINKILWASTHRGLIRIDLRRDTGKDYLAPESPFRPRGLDVADGRAWVGTGSGLYSFDAESGAWRHYSRNDGLISNFVTDLIINGDYIWLGTNIGLTRINWRNLY